MLKLIVGAAIAASLLFAPGPAHAQSEAASGQSRADYYAWLARAPENRDQVVAFRDELAQAGVEAVVPVWQLVRTSHSWRGCGATPFEVAPASSWGHIVDTLRFVRDQVVPALG